jgi:hypothetical protein
MRFMMLIKADKVTEAGVLPTQNDIEVMGKYNEELVKAQVVLDMAGLQPSSKGARLTFQNGTVHVTDGPFAETKELIAGYWVIEVKSKQEAVEWAKRIPFAHLPASGRVPEVELRQLFEVTDFPGAPPEIVELEESFKATRETSKK